jgi:hypothetical protein
MRRHPWSSAGVLLLITFALAVAAWWLQEPNNVGQDASNGVGVNGGVVAGLANVLGLGEQRTAQGNFYEVRGKVVHLQAPVAGTSAPGVEMPTGAPSRQSSTPQTSATSHRLVRVGDVPMAAASYQTRPDLAARVEAAAAGRIAALVALPGQRGAGKTQLAAAVARKRMSDGWPVVAWINAETQAGLQSGLDELATELSIREEKDNATKAARRVRQYLESDGNRCLIVFDNAEDVGTLRPFLPRSGGAQIVITTTRRSFTRLGGATVIDVGGFTPPEAVAYLQARTQLQDPLGAAKLAQELGHLPLGLAQASWVIISQGLTYQAYLYKLHRQPINEVLLRDAADEYQLTVVQAISLALDDLDRRGETSSRRLLELICLLSSDGVPRRYLRDIPKAGFEQSRQVQVEVLSSSQREELQTVEFPALPTADAVDLALGSLAEASLLLFSEDRSRVNVHRLVAMVVRFLSRDWRAELANRAQNLLSQPGRTGEVSERAWRRWIDPTAMLPDDIMSGHWETLVKALRAGGMQVEWARLNDLVAQYRALLDNVDDERWKWRETAAAWINEFGLDSAIDRARNRVSELESSMGRNSLATAYARVNLAYAYWAGHRLEEATKEFKRVVRVFRRVHGIWHTRTRMVTESLDIVQAELNASKGSQQ